MLTTAPLALGGLRFRAALWLLLALGLVPATALTVLAAGMQLETRIAGVQQAVDGLDTAQRTALAVTSVPIDTGHIAGADAVVRGGFEAAGFESVKRTLTFRLLSVSGTDVTLGAVEPLPDTVRLLTGRLPTSCSSTRCEVLAVQAAGGVALGPAEIAAAPRAFGVVVTGTAALTDRRLVEGGLVTPSVPLLLGADPTAITELAALTGYGRTAGWIATVSGAAVADRGASATQDALDRMVGDFGSAYGPVVLRWPADVADAAVARSAGAGARFAALGSGVGALQLAFCAVVAVGVRRRTRWVCGVLRARGAPSWCCVVLAVLQPIPAILLGALVGVASGVLVVAGRLHGVLGGTFAPALGRALEVTGPALGTVAALSLAALGLTALVSALPDRVARSSQLVIDTVTVLLLGIVLADLTDVITLTGSTPFLAVVLLAGLLASRVVPLLPRIASGLHRLRPRRARPVGIAALSRRASARRPLIPAVLAGFLAAACALGVFAVSYRASLGQSAADRAAAQVPLDLRVSPSTQISTPGDVIDVGALRAAAPDVTIGPLTSTAISVAAGTPRARSTNLVGIDAGTVLAMNDFPVTTGTGLGAAELAGRLRTSTTTDQRPRLAAGTVRFTASGVSSDVDVALWIELAGGAQRAVRLQPANAASVTELVARIPSPATVIAVEVIESAAHLMHRQHGIGEGDTDRAQAAGTLVLSATAPASGGAADTGWTWTGWTAAHAEITDTADRISVRYRIGDQRVVVVPPAAPGEFVGSEQQPLPMVVDLGTASAAVDGTLSVAVGGARIVGRIVAVAPFWPGLSGPFAVVDRAAISRIVSSEAPGTQPVTQVWLAAPAAQLPALRAALADSGASAATITARSTVEDALRADPASVRTILMVVIAAIVALLLAAVAAAIAVRADHDGSAPEQLVLELDGLRPNRLQSLLLGRSLGAGVLGIAVGCAAGLWAAQLGVPALAGSAATVPPLRIVGQVGASFIAVVALTGAALAAVVAARTLFRGDRPALLDGDVR
ncbi:hypothetical protein ABLG96_09810 [Nakamurella sp. A5-74]|uniref:FtsX-like permease family protein n=1 Tax=Nakamurella sp. A5-74 TaxID=3158264 RepID=A0AAU8DU67_9ACTN